MPRKKSTIFWIKGNPDKRFNIRSCIILLKRRVSQVRTKGRVTGLKTIEMLRPLFKVPSMRIRCNQEVYAIALCSIIPGDGTV